MSAMNAETVPFRYTPNGLFGAYVEVAGQDMTDVVNRVSFDHKGGEPPRVFLELTGWAQPNEINVDARVTLVQPANESDQREQVIEWLSNIDPEQLEKDTLEGLGTLEVDDATSTGAAFLATLKRYANGKHGA